MSTINKIVFETQVESGVVYNPGFDWSINASPANAVTLDWENRVNATATFDFPQGVWIDNSANTNTITIQILGTGQFLTVPPSSVFTAPLFPNRNPKILVTNKNDVTPNVGQTQLVFTSWRLDYLSVANASGGATAALQATGNTSLASILTTLNTLSLAQGSNTAGQDGILVQGAVSTNAPAYTTGQTSPLSLNTSGGLRSLLMASTGAILDAATASGNTPARAIVTMGGCTYPPLTLATGQSSPLAQNTAGVLFSDCEGQKTTYRASGTITPAATPTDILTINGVATGPKVIKIRRLILSVIATTAGSMTIQIAKRSTSNTGGTSTNSTAVPMDSQDTAATATITQYSVNPTALGTLTGYIDTRIVQFPTAALGTPNTVDIDFGKSGGQAATIRTLAVNQNIAVYLGGAALVVGATIAYTVEWTEATE